MPEIGQIHRTEYEIENSKKMTGKHKNQPPETRVSIAESSGRIHFLGDQSDPANGYYLSAAIDRHISVAVSFRKDNSFRFFSYDLNERKRATLSNFRYKREDRWANYLKTAVFLFIELGYPIKGLNFSFCGNIPQHIALASSTAMETAAAAAVKNLYNINIKDEELAQRLHKAHELFFGQTSLLADYQVCLLGRKNQFLVLDSSTDEIIRIKSPLTRFRILLIDSRVPRLGVENEITSRKDDIKKGINMFAKKLNGSSIKDYSSSDLLETIGSFPEQIRRRCVHIYNEIQRVDTACDALQRSDLAAFAKIIFHSHESLRDLCEISCPEVDWLVKRAQEMEGVAGSRMIGHGFGGCTYTILRREMAGIYLSRLEEYERIFGFRPTSYEIKLDLGTRILSKNGRAYANTVN